MALGETENVAENVAESIAKYKVNFLIIGLANLVCFIVLSRNGRNGAMAESG